MNDNDQEMTMTDPRSYDVPGPLTARLNSQTGPETGQIEPGTEGYWTVHGARAIDIRPGDLVMSGWKDQDDPAVLHHAEYEVTELAPWGDLRDSCRVRFLTTAGRYASVGMLQPMVLVRRGTHRTLADSVR